MNRATLVYRLMVPAVYSAAATGSFQPYRIAIKRSPKQRTAPTHVARVDERCGMCPNTTTAAPARAATAEGQRAIRQELPRRRAASLLAPRRCAANRQRQSCQPPVATSRFAMAPTAKGNSYQSHSEAIGREAYWGGDVLFFCSLLIWKGAGRRGGCFPFAESGSLPALRQIPGEAAA